MAVRRRLIACAAVAAWTALAAAGCSSGGSAARHTDVSPVAPTTSADRCFRVDLGPVPSGVTVQAARHGAWVLTKGSSLIRVVALAPAQARLREGSSGVCADRPARVVRAESRLVEGARWTQRGTTRSLSITPAWAARQWPGATDDIVGELRGRYPELARPGMIDQLRCHVTFAPSKATWRLEPARPEVGYLATVAARCNPGNERDADGH